MMDIYNNKIMQKSERAVDRAGPQGPKSGRATARPAQ